jgi:DNA-binding IclR family transcriptional regulator
MEQTNCTLLLSIFEGAIITIVDKEEPLSSMRVAASIGMRIPFCAGASGQAFLAYLPDAKIEELLLKPGLKAFTPTSITNPDRYRATLLKVRKQGYAVDDNEQYLQGVGAIAVPLFAPTFEGEKARSVTAVITLVSFSSHLSPEKIAEFTGPMLEAGQKISGMLGR